MCCIVRRSSEGSSSQEQLSVDGIRSELADDIDTACSTAASTPQQDENTDQLSERTEVGAASNNQNTLAIDPDPLVASGDSDEMKRAHAKQLIEKYFYQLSDGCGNPNCTNRNCASSGEVEALTPNQAAARAIRLFSEEAPLCGVPSTKLARLATNDEPVPVLVQSSAASNVTVAASTFDKQLTKTNDAYR